MSLYHDCFGDIGLGATSTVRTVYRDSTTVRAVQLKLKALAERGGIDVGPLPQTVASDSDLDPGDIDGVFGPATQSAVKAYQVLENLPKTDGLIDDATVISLGMPTPSARTSSPASSSAAKTPAADDEESSSSTGLIVGGLAVAVGVGLVLAKKRKKTS